jgi:hypothetical protein
MSSCFFVMDTNGSTLDHLLIHQHLRRNCMLLYLKFNAQLITTTVKGEPDTMFVNMGTVF